MKKIKLDAIRIDGGTQGRAVIDQTTVYNYVEHMKEGDEFPKMFAFYDGATYWLVDGFHRYHAYKLLGITEIEIAYKPGTLEEAQVYSFGVNATHGKPRTNEDKRKVVEAALEHPLTKNKSNYEIAKICAVSQPFVAAVRSPEAKKRQAENDKRRTLKDAEKIKAEEAATTNGISSEKTTPPAKSDPEPNPHDGDAPSREEIEAAEEALKADQDMMYKLLESDEPLKVAVEENKRLNLRVAQLEARLRGLMNERNTAVDMVKKLQKQLDKTKDKK